VSGPWSFDRDPGDPAAPKLTPVADELRGPRCPAPAPAFAQTRSPRENKHNDEPGSLPARPERAREGPGLGRSGVSGSRVEGCGESLA
jgi:hypothetical protein